MQGKNMDLIHLLIIAVAVLCCHCQRSEHHQTSGTLQDILNGQAVINQKLQGIEDKIKSAATAIEDKIIEATKKIKGLIGEVYCLSEDNPLRLSQLCYFFSPYRSTWSSAKQRCEKHGGFLSFILDDRQFEFIKENSGVHDYWIGLSKSVGTETYIWSHNGNSHDKSWWAEGEPSNRDREDCVEFNGASTKKLKNANCSIQKGFICVFGDGSPY